MWYSQIGQDRWVAKLHRRSTSPWTFVEAGAADGIRNSNTLALEQSGEWRGLCVEPGPEFSLLQKNRHCRTTNVLLGSQAGVDATLFVPADPQLASVVDGHGALTGDRFLVRSERLDDVLDREFPGVVHIDYLSLDTEGSELDVLAGLDPRRYVVASATIEHNYDRVRRRQIRREMSMRGLRRVQRRKFDDWYINPAYFSPVELARQAALAGGYQVQRVARGCVRRTSQRLSRVIELARRR